MEKVYNTKTEPLENRTFTYGIGTGKIGAFEKYFKKQRPNKKLKYEIKQIVKKTK